MKSKLCYKQRGATLKKLKHKVCICVLVTEYFSPICYFIVLTSNSNSILIILLQNRNNKNKSVSQRLSGTVHTNVAF